MSQLAPGNPFPERGRITIDAKIATPRPTRAGDRPFEEGLGHEAGVAGGFAAGALPYGQEQQYLTIPAGHAHGRDALAEGQFVPTWDAVDKPMLRGFMSGAIDERLRQPDFRFTGREMNRSTQTDLFRGLGAGERPRQRYTTVIAPENGGRRVNRADIREL